MQDVDGFLLGACHSVEGGETVLVAGNGILKVEAGGNAAAHNLEEGDLSEVLLNVVLVDEQGGGAVFLALGGGSHVAHELHQPLHADVLLAADAEHGISLAGLDAQGEAVADLLLAEGALLEELLHQGVVILGGLLDEFLAVFLGLVGEFCGNIELLAGAVGILEAVILHCEDVDESVEGHTGIGGELDVNHLAAEGFLEFSLNLFPVGLLGVELVHGDDHRELDLLGAADESFRSDLDSLLGVHHENTALADLECGVCAADEVVGAGGVDEVDLLAHKLCIERCGVDGTLVELFKLVVVGHGVFVFN